MRHCECGTPALHLKPAFSSGEIDFRCCPSCGLVFRETFPNPNELEEIYRQAYEAEKIATGGTNQESGAFVAKSYATYIHTCLGPQPSAQDRILDYGAGSGELVSEIRQRGLTAEGLEFAPEARRYCERHRGFSLRTDLRDVPDGHYALVSMIEVIEHLTELQDSLKEIRRVLAPEGMLLVTTPNRHGLRARKEKGYWREAQKKFHLFLFDWRSLRFHIESAGFENIRRIQFSPMKRLGFKVMVTSRVLQALRLSGTLCVIANRPK